MNAGRSRNTKPNRATPAATRSKRNKQSSTKKDTVVNAKTFSILLLGVTLCAIQEARAANPRTHPLHGVVQSVDATAHSLTVQKSNKAQPLVIQWDEGTRFRDGKEPAQPESVKAGQAVCVYYRVLPGRLGATSDEVRRESTIRENGSAKGGASDLMRH